MLQMRIGVRPVFNKEIRTHVAVVARLFWFLAFEAQFYVFWHGQFTPIGIVNRMRKCTTRCSPEMRMVLAADKVYDEQFCWCGAVKEMQRMD